MSKEDVSYRLAPTHRLEQRVIVVHGLAVRLAKNSGYGGVSTADRDDVGREVRPVLRGERYAAPGVRRSELRGRHSARKGIRTAARELVCTLRGKSQGMRPAVSKTLPANGLCLPCVH